jgi:NAD(P) transhydrogenase
MGELAKEVVHIGLIAMVCDASANLFVEACLNMPTLGILYKTATLNALQKLQKSTGPIFARSATPASGLGVEQQRCPNS